MMTIYRLSAEHQPWGFACEFDFSPGMVEGIKTHIPSRQRTWKPDLRQWWFRAEVIDSVCTLATLFCEGGYVHAQSSPAPAHRGPEAAYQTLHLLPSAPPELVKAAYKALSKLEHPDKGGDKARMQAINSAYGILSHRQSQN